MNREHLTRIVTFGKRLVETGDLDPVYIALRCIPLRQRMRAVFAYSCLYHLGLSAYLSERTGENFWHELQVAARNEDGSWPRGTERRHWRGRAAVECARYLGENYREPEDVIHYWYASTFTSTVGKIKTTPQFGPWIAFKIADLMERVLDLPVDFSDCELGFYREPRAGAALLIHGNTETAVTQGEVCLAVDALLAGPLGKLLAPPSDNRRLNVQEIETILCKYKSGCGGHYWPGKDTVEVYHGLSDLRWGASASKMKHKLKPLVERYWSELI